MPVTARLSMKFYQKFGEDVATELVEWLNSVDTAYRQEFRDLFEVHFGRFEARLQQGLAELRGELRSEFKLDIGALRSELKSDIGALRSELKSDIGELRSDISVLRKDLGVLQAMIESRGTRLIAWSFGFWIANLVTVLTVLKLAGVL